MKQQEIGLVGAGLLLAGGIVLSGCPGEDKFDTWTQFCEAWGGTLCTAQERCCPAEQINAELCALEFQHECTFEVQPFLDSGKINFRGNKAWSCHSAFDDALSDCVLDEREPEVCDQIVEGTVSPGNSCEMSAECSGMAFCDWQDNVCVEIPGAGDSCVETIFCQDGLYCDVDDICKQQKEEGDSCTTATSNECAHGLYCGSSERCVIQKSTGMECSSYEECRSYDCNAGGTCEPYPDICQDLANGDGNSNGGGNGSDGAATG